MAIAPLTGKAKKAYHRSNARLNVFEGSVSSGKTITSILRWIKYIKTCQPGPLMMVGKTERSLKRNVIDPMTEILGRSRVVYRQGAGEVTVLGRRIYISGANDERAHEKLRGTSLAGAYADEISTYPASFTSMLVSRLRVGKAKLFATSNPDSMMHYLYTDYLERAAYHLAGDGTVVRRGGPDVIDLARFSFRLSDNPYLDPEYLEAVEKEYTGLFYKRFILGEWVLAEGVCYDMFDPSIHMVDDLPPIDRFWVGIDYGTQNPFHAVLIGLGVDDNLYVCREYRYDSKKERRQKTDAQYSRDLSAWIRGLGMKDVYGRDAQPAYVVIDPSATSFIVQCQTDKIFGLAKADNKVLDGIRCVSSLLSNRRLFLHRSCSILAGELTSYAWDSAAALKGEDAPLKVNDHAADSLRYSIFTARALWHSRIYRLAA